MKRKCSKELYCEFLIAAQTNFTATACASLLTNIAHDSITRLLSEKKFTPSILWEYSQQLVSGKGVIVVDDTVLDHPYSETGSLIRFQYSGTHHDVVKGIGVTTLLWSGERDEHIPINYRLYDPDNDDKTKNEHTREMLHQTKDRGIIPDFVTMDKFYAATDTLHLIAHDFGWHFVCALKSNRLVYLGYGKKNRFPISEVDVPKEGGIVHLKDFGSVKIFRFVASDGKAEHLATSKLDMNLEDVKRVYAQRWTVEEYHRGLKQTVGIESCQARSSRSQRNHIFCSLLSFLALEKKRLEEGVSWYEAKRSIIADSLFLYLKKPFIPLPSPVP